MVDSVNFFSIAIGFGLGFAVATLLWWTLLFAGAKRIIDEALRKRSFRYYGTLYFIRRAGEGNLTGGHDV